MTIKLEKLRDELTMNAGYAYDLVMSILRWADPDYEPEPGEVPEQLEADALFRVLVLDHHYDVELAVDHWRAAIEVIDEAESVLTPEAAAV